ncbi:MAG: hypothetical protein AAFQ41_14740 [Cyanobacteria bacterium J06623_7]
MNLKQQLQLIIDNAASHGVPPLVVQKAIAPTLESYARQLQQLEYYVLQNLKADWVVTTINNPQLQQEKRVIYAFVSVRDAAVFQGQEEENLVAVPIAIVQLLFRLLALSSVDSIIFLENSHNLNSGREIERRHLSAQIEQQLKQLSKSSPNIA